MPRFFYALEQLFDGDNEEKITGHVFSVYDRKRGSGIGQELADCNHAADAEQIVNALNAAQPVVKPSLGVFD